MITIEADQLIYTRVEADFSPQKKEGFQTVYKSEGLSSSEVKEIETHVQCFSPDSTTNIGLQFFKLHEERVVIANTTVIETHPEITDTARHRGAFLTHCLILNQINFEQIDYNPFTVFNTYPFLNDAEKMVHVFGQATGKAPSTKITLEKSKTILSSNWSSDELLKLLLLAVQANQLLVNKTPIFLTGNHTNIRQTLELLFFLMPQENRCNCSFNTFINHCFSKPGRYWAMGNHTKQSSYIYIHVDTIKKCIMDKKINTIDIKNRYLHWFKHSILHNDVNTVLKNVPTIQQINQAFVEKNSLQTDSLQKDACEEFLHLYLDDMRERLEGILTKKLGRRIARSLTQTIYHTLYDSRIILNIITSQLINPVELSQILVDWLIKEHPHLKRSDWKKVQRIAYEANHLTLLYLSTVLNKKSILLQSSAVLTWYQEKKDYQIRQESLAKMDKKTFKALLEQTFNLIEPAYLVNQIHLNCLLSSEYLHQISDEQFINLVRAILKINTPHKLETLIPYIDRLSDRSVIHLHRLINNKANVPQRFIKRLAKYYKEDKKSNWFKLFQTKFKE